MFISDRPSLRQIHVKGDLIVKPETQNGKEIFNLNLHHLNETRLVIITRSRAKQSSSIDLVQ